MKAARRYDVHEAKARLPGVQKQVAMDEESVIGKTGSLWPEVRRIGRGSLKGLIHIPDDFDELPDDIADAFGAR